MTYMDLQARTYDEQARAFEGGDVVTIPTPNLLAIDPGPEQSAIVLYDPNSKRPLYAEKLVNFEVMAFTKIADAESLAIEMVASYGMAVGAEVFETCLWIGRFLEGWQSIDRSHLIEGRTRKVYRREVKLHLCADSRAKDANIRQAIIDRYGGKEKAIGLKKTPGPLYGMAGDCWSALGVAITAAETEEPDAS